MVALPCSVFLCSGDITRFEQWVVAEDLFTACSSGKQVKNICDPDSQAAKTGPSTTLGRINGDSAQFTHRVCPCAPFLPAMRFRCAIARHMSVPTTPRPPAMARGTHLPALRRGERGRRRRDGASLLRSDARLGQLGVDRRLHRVQRVLYLGCLMRERDVELALALQDAALAEPRVEALLHIHIGA
jgi:hypothetical protein